MAPSRLHARVRANAAQRAAGPRTCDHPDCAAAGEFRAPRARDKLDEFWWFCLDHVRAYNATWDYYRGMNEHQIERERRFDTVGRRPTWPMGPRGRHGAEGHVDPEMLRAAIRRLFGDEAFHEEPRRAPRPPTPGEEALRMLDLPPDASVSDIKARYKTLAKLHHPDANGGDKAAEERLKSINQAYSFLKAQALQAKHVAGD